MDVLEAFGVFSTQGDVGIEIEVEGRNLPGNVNRLSKEFTHYWNLERDGSLRGEENFEYILKKPLSLLNAEVALQVLNDQYEKDGSVIDDSVRAGIHVHVNVQDMTVLQLLTFITCYYVVENVLTRFCGEGRQGNHFCLRSQDAEYQVMAICNAIETKDWFRLRTDDIRYSAMNVSSLGKYGSVEFRAMRSTRDTRRIHKWASILHHMKEASKEFENPKEVVFSMSADGEEFFMEKLFGKYKKDLHTPHTTEDIQVGVRFAQDIGFATNWDLFNDGGQEVKKRKRKAPRYGVGPIPAPKPINWVIDDVEEVRIVADDVQEDF